MEGDASPILEGDDNAGEAASIIAAASSIDAPSPVAGESQFVELNAIAAK